MSERGEEALILRIVLRPVLEDILGSAGARVLEYHFKKIASGDLYTVLRSDPKSFYQVLTKFFGSGTSSFIRTIASLLLAKYNLIGEYTTEELAKILMGETENPKSDLQKFLEKTAYAEAPGRGGTGGDF